MNYVHNNWQRGKYIIFLPLYLLLLIPSGIRQMGYRPKRAMLIIFLLSCFLLAVSIILSGHLFSDVVKIILMYWAIFLVMIAIIFRAQKKYGFPSLLHEGYGIPTKFTEIYNYARCLYSWLLIKSLWQPVKIDKDNLSNANLSQINIAGLNMKSANLQKSFLQKCYLLFCNLQNADLAGSEIRQSNLQCADLSNANLTECVMERSDLEFATLNSANLNKADLSQSKFGGAQATNIQAKETNFMFADLTQTNFTGVYFENTKFACANLKNTNFSDARFQSCDLRQSIYVKDATWQGAVCDKNTLFSDEADENKEIRSYLVKFKGLILK